MKKTTCMRIVFKTELLLQLWTGDLYISRMCTKDQYGGIGVTFFLSFTPFKFRNHFFSEFSSICQLSAVTQDFLARLNYNYARFQADDITFDTLNAQLRRSCFGEFRNPQQACKPPPLTNSTHTCELHWTRYVSLSMPTFHLLICLCCLPPQ